MQEPKLSAWVKNQRKRFLQRPCQLSDEQVEMLKAETGFGSKKFGQGLSPQTFFFLVSFLDGHNEIIHMACCGIRLGRLSAGTSWLPDVLAEVEPFERVP